jgi:exosome complex component RRP4
MFQTSEVKFSFDSLKNKNRIDNNEVIKECFNQFVELGYDGLTYKKFTLLLDALFVNALKTPYHMPIQWKIDLFRLFDLNSDSVISFEEFILMWNNWIEVILNPKSALIVVDVQNDFISGSLSVNRCPAGHNGEDVIPVINQLIDCVPFDLIVYSLDWHPMDHISFYENLDKRKFKPIDNHSETESKNVVQVYDTVIFEGPPQTEQKLWPTHCVQQTWGSQLHSNLKVSSKSVFVYKGTQSNIDSYSAFWDNQKLSQTNLNEELEKKSITDVYVCGLAYDVCVGSTAFHSTEFGYGTVIIDDACRGLCNLAIDQVKNKLSNNKAIIVNANKVHDMVKGIDRRPELGYAKAFKNR